MKPLEKLHKPNGYFWVSIISLIAAPLAYYRSLILGWSSKDGELVGMYSIALIFMEIISTFVLIGGGTVITSYLPKLESPREKSIFLTRYTAMNIALLFALTCISLLFPNSHAIANQLAEYEYGLYPLLILGPFTLLSVMLTFALSGIGAFTLSGLLTNVQLMLVCAVSTLFFFVDRKFFAAHGIPIFIGTIAIAQLFNVIISTIKLRRSAFQITFAGSLPKGFFRFASHIHINSICNFTYRSGDQIFVLGALGVKELGAYFIAVQLADLINYLPLRTSQIMLTKFSGMIHNKSYENVTTTYALLTRVISCIAGSAALFLIFFSVPLASIFGDWGNNKAVYLQWLAFIAVLGCLNSVNSMLIMASESTSLYLAINIAQMCVQLLATIYLINTNQVFGVISAKFLGMLVLQCGLFMILRSGLASLKINISWHYFFTVAIVLTAIIFLKVQPATTMTQSITGFVCFAFAYHLILRVGPSDFRSLLLRN